MSSFAYQEDFVLWIYNLFGTKVAAIHNAKDIVVEDRLQNMETLSFTMMLNDPKYSSVIEDGEVECLGRFYRIEEKNDERLSSVGKGLITCSARWLEIVEKRWPGTRTILAKTPAQGMTTILTGSGWTVGDTPVDSTLYSMEETDGSYVSLLRRWASVTGYELEFDTVTREVHLVAAVGLNRGLGFFYGKNLLEIKRKLRPPLATRLYAYGANNLSFAAVNPSGLDYIEDYTWYTGQGMTLLEAQARYRKDDIWVDDKFLTPIALFDAANARLDVLSKPVVSYSCKVVDLARLTASALDDLAIGDEVLVSDEILNTTIRTRVVRILRRPLDPENNEVELQYLEPGVNPLTDSTQTRSTSSSDIAILVDENENPVTINTGLTEYNSISLTTAGTATLVSGSTFAGVATGSGTVRFWKAMDGAPVGEFHDKVFANGDKVEHSWPSWYEEIVVGSHTVTWRAQVVSGTGTIELAPLAGRSWILTRGAVGVGLNMNPSQSITETLVDAEFWLELSDIHIPGGDTVEVEIIPMEEIDTDVLSEDIAFVGGTEFDDGVPSGLEIMRFIIEDPTFGVIEGPGVIP